MYSSVSSGKSRTTCRFVTEEETLNFVFTDGSEVRFPNAMWTVGDCMFLASESQINGVLEY